MATHKQTAEDFYAANYKGKGIAPKYVVALKEALTRASRKGEKLATAAKALLKEKGVVLGGDTEASPKPAKKVVKKAVAVDNDDDEEEEEAPQAKVKKSNAEISPVDMDVKSLRGTLEELKRAGISHVEYSKKDDVNALREKVTEAIKEMTSPRALKMLEKISPAKLKDLNLDCLGLFIDMRTPSCVSCPTQGECVKAYIQNLGNNFSGFTAAIRDMKTEKAAASVTDEHVEVKKSKAVEKQSTKETPKPSRSITVHNIKNPDKGGEDEKMIDRIINEKPKTLRKLRKILDDYYEVEAREPFQALVKELRRSGVISLGPKI